MRSFRTFDEISGAAGKKTGEKGLYRLENLCGLLALSVDVLSLLFLLGPLKDLGILKGVLILGMLMNFSEILVGVLRKSRIITAAALIFFLLQTVALIWFLI